MINIAQGNETVTSVTSVAGIGLVGGLLRQCPSLGRLDALRLERTKHGRIPHSRVVLCHICLAALGMNDYADVEDFAASWTRLGEPFRRRRPAASASASWARTAAPSGCWTTSSWSYCGAWTPGAWRSAAGSSSCWTSTCP